MRFELAMIVVVESLDGRLLDRAVHSLDLPVFRGIGPLDQFLFLKTPGMLHFSQAVLDAVLATTHIEHVCHVARCRSVGVARRERELDAVVGQNGMDPIGHCLNEGHEEGGRRGSPGLSDDLHEGEFARAINGHVKVQLAFGSLNLSDIDVEVAPSRRCLASPVGQGIG